jgi:ABC-type amino acid transport substrate-binding protein
LQTAKYSLPILCLALTFIQCGGHDPDAPDAMADMQKNKLVRIATDAVNLPFSFGSGTGVQGFDVDIGAEIGKDLGYEVKWIKMPFERLFEILKKGEVELVLSAISITPERKKEFAFSEPYFESGNTIAHRRDKKTIKDLASLAGKKVGAQSSSTGQRFLESQKAAANVTITKFPTLDDALGALNRTEIDAVVGDEPILTYSIYKSFPNLMTGGLRVTEEEYGVVMRKNEKELLAKVNATIARLKKSGELVELRKKWFQDVMERTSTERQEMRKDEQLREAPKAVSFNIVKTGGGYNLDRLDGFEVNLVGSNGAFKSTPITTSGNRGSCRFSAPIPPGEYRLNMPALRINTTINIPKTASRSVTIDMRITPSGIDFVPRTS